LSTPATLGTLTIDPKAVVVSWRARSDLGEINDLVTSIQEQGQIHPIVVMGIASGKYELLAGYRRLKACEMLKVDVRAEVRQPTDALHALAIQLHENMRRKGFDLLEESEGFRRYKELYEAAHPETKHGAAGGGHGKAAVAARAGAPPAPRFTEVAAKATAISERRVSEMLEISRLPVAYLKEIRNAKTTSERNRLSQEALRKVRSERKVKRMQEEVAARRQLDLSEARKPPVVIYCGDYRNHPSLKATEQFDLCLTDPPYDRDRSLIGHVARASIGKTLDWDKLDLGWVLRVAPTLAPRGQILAFCPFEAVGAYELAFQAAKLSYKGCLVWHKCVSEDTLIPVVTEDGLHRLRPAEIQPGDCIISVGAGGEAVLAKVTSTERMGRRESLVRITLADGNTVAVTPSHRIPTRGGRLVEAGKLGAGDEVLVATTFPIESPGSEYKEARDLGRIAGIWLGDGGASSSRASRVDFCLSRSKAETVAFLEDALPRFFDAKVNKYIDGEEGIRLYANNDALRSFLGGVFEGRTSKTKRIRPQTFFQGREFLQGLSDGFCETDGGWDENNRRWRFNQANAALLRDYSILLKVLGLPSKLYPPRVVDDGTSTLHTCWPMEFRPEISRHHNSMFKDEARGVCPVKIAKIEFAPGGAVWDLAVDSASHLFAVDHGMLVHNSNPGPVYRASYQWACEAIVWAAKGDGCTFLPWEEQAGATAHNLIEGAICQGNERTEHPTQKPLWLIMRLLQRHAIEGQRILDPFCGSGTTLVAARKLGLEAIGIEREEKFAELARLRMQQLRE